MTQTKNVNFVPTAMNGVAFSTPAAKMFSTE